MSKHLHERIGITFQEFGALLGARTLLAAGQVEYDPVANRCWDTSKAKACKGAHLFDMNSCGRTHGCGTVGCIGGLMALIMGVDCSYVAQLNPWDEPRSKNPLTKLFYPGGPLEGKYEGITPAMAVKAIDQFLSTKGKKAWEGIVV